MKLKNKLILILIFFTCFFVFNKSDCFAVTYTSSSAVKSSSLSDISYNNISALLDFCYSTGLVDNSYNYFYYQDFVSSSELNFSTGNFYVDNSSSDTNKPRYFDADYIRFVFSASSNNVKIYFYTLSSSEKNLTESLGNWVFSKGTFYFRRGLLDKSTGQVVIGGIESDSTKQDLFQLNLTDKNFNNSQHTFTLNIDKNAVNYSELANLIENNNKYCIYITDYTRLLTFSDNSFNATLESGSYLLSGFIDFLVSDNAYFYFSPHYNRIKVCSGDYRGQDMSTYTKRYFFNLVYSDDSDDAYFTILEDNGLLWSFSDYVNDGSTGLSEQISDISNSYFIGSNQTIYFAQEDNNYILDSLTDSIYYGKNRNSDTRVYNFGFSGGHTKEFYLNDLLFNNNVTTENDSLIDKIPFIETDETAEEYQPVVIPDSSGGNSSVIPQDETTYTYPQNTVTDETNSEDDSTHVEDERLPYISSDSQNDTSNWSIWDFIKGIFNTISEVLSGICNLVSDLISGLISLFVPSSSFFSNTFTELNNLFELKLGFIFYPFEFFMNLFDRITNIEFCEPVISIPEIREPFTNDVLIHAVEFNFNSLLEDERINVAHNYYLMFVDAILVIGFINLLKNKFEEVMRK